MVVRARGGILAGDGTEDAMTHVTGALLERIAGRAAEQGRWVEAARGYGRALALLDDGAPPADRFRLRDSLTGVIAAQGRAGEAADLALASVLESARQGLPRPLRLRLHVRAAMLAIDAGRLVEAIDLHDRLLEQLVDSDALAAVWNNLGTLHWRLGRLARAEAAFHRALGLLDGGPESPLLETVLENLGALLVEAGEPGGELRFDRFLSAHGSPLRRGAHEAVRAAVDRAFPRS